MEQSGEPKIKAVERAFGIVEALLELDGATTGTVSEYLDIPLSTTSDHLATLEALNYVVERADGYHVSSKFLKIGNDMRFNREICRVCRPELTRLRRETGEHAGLMLEENGFGIYYVISKSESSIRVIADIGARTLLHTNAPGLLLLSFIDDGRVDEIVDRHGLSAMTENTVSSRAALRERVATIRDQGYAVDREEAIVGMYGVAAPVFDRDENEILGAISLYTAADQDIDHFLDENLNPLQRTANTIELELAYG